MEKHTIQEVMAQLDPKERARLTREIIVFFDDSEILRAWLAELADPALYDLYADVTEIRAGLNAIDGFQSLSGPEQDPGV